MHRAGVGISSYKRQKLRGFLAAPAGGGSPHRHTTTVAMDVAPIVDLHV
jgi:hypothetical protein